MIAVERAGPPPSHSASRGLSIAISVQCTRNVSPRTCIAWSIVEPLRSGESDTWETDLWIVTQSPRRWGSMMVSHTCSIGASISILAETVLIARAH